MTVLGAIRADDVNFPLFIHILSAMVLVGSLLLTSTVLAGVWRDGSAERTRVAFRTLLMAVLPSWLITRVFAQIVADKPPYEAAEDADAAWLAIGYSTTEFGLLLIIAATVAAGVGSRRALREGGPVGTSARVAAVLTWLLVVFYVVAIWAMTAKPE
jgi:hypothetical protein